MALDEIFEIEEFENVNIQEDDLKPEGNNDNNVEINADEIQNESEDEPINEPENEEALIEEEVNPSTEDDKEDPNVKIRVSRPLTKLTMAQNHLHTQAHSQKENTPENEK
jgi:hypothetical protein